jgi:dephospho-CoA kinase
MRVLLTGMSGTGKSTLVAELRRRGFMALDADDDGYSEPTADGRWSWRIDAVRGLLAQHRDGVLFFAGCSEEQGRLPFDRTVLLTAPEAVLLDRLRSRTTNPYGRSDGERAQVLADLREVEPLLRASADLVVDATAPVHTVADVVLADVRTAA